MTRLGVWQAVAGSGNVGARAMRVPAHTTERVATAEPLELALLLVSAAGTKTLPVTRASVLTVGRAWPSDVVFDDASLSRSHARISILEDELVVEDLGSTNGTWTSRGRITRSRVAFGDFVRLGDVHLSIRAPHAARARRAMQWVSFDDFEAWAKAEVGRARTFRRATAFVEWVVSSELAGVVERTLRDIDVVTRYAGDRLWVGLCEATRADAEAHVARTASLLGGARSRTVVFPEDGATADALFDALRSGQAASSVASFDRPYHFGAELEAIRHDVARVAASQLPVLIYGETGVGKEVFAREVHACSKRAGAAFVVINCAAIPAGLVESTLFGHERGAFTGADRLVRGVFELASGGTLFLDEVGELPHPAQAALLRVLETGLVRRVGSERDVAVDVRLVSATHRDLLRRVEEGHFRQDLLFRLDGVSFEIPPLRERRADIAALAALFVTQANQENARGVAAIGPEAGAILQAYGWPGNVRELRNAVFRAVVVTRGTVLAPEDLPARLRAAPQQAIAPPPAASPLAAPPPPASPLAAPPPVMPAGTPALEGADELLDYRSRVERATADVERRILIEALERHGGNQTATATALQMPIRTLTHKLKQLGITRSFG